MDQRSQFLLQLLDKLGAPLMEAINLHAASAPDQTGQKDAQTLSVLLTETVKISISLSQAMNLRPDDGNADAIRVGLAAIAGELVASNYSQTGRLPGEQDGRRITKALESVLAFADNFAPAAEHAQRLMTLDNTPPFFDPMQASLYSLNALVPAIAAIEEFPFGHTEGRLIGEVAARLDQKAKAMQSEFAPAGDRGHAAMAEMVILQALARIYAGAHRAETLRLRGLSDDARGELSLDPVWESVDRQARMLEVLLGAMVPGGAQSSARGGGGGVRPAPESQPEQQAQAPAQPAAPPQKAGGNPMSFFKKGG